MKEQTLKYLANTDHGKDIQTYLEEVVREFTDVRQLIEIKPEEVKARAMAADLIEEKILNRIKVHSGELKEVDKNIYT